MNQIYCLVALYHNIDDKLNILNIEYCIDNDSYEEELFRKVYKKYKIDKFPLFDNEKNNEFWI